jgi:hypothetical protein
VKDRSARQSRRSIASAKYAVAQKPGMAKPARWGYWPAAQGVSFEACGRSDSSNCRPPGRYPSLSLIVATVTCGQRTLLKIRITSCEYCSCK